MTESAGPSRWFATMPGRLPRFARTLLALGAFFVMVVALTACGGGIPGNSVAKVDQAGNITKTDFNHWLLVAAKGSQAPGANGQPQIPDAPDYTQCIASKRKALPKPAKGQKAPTDAQLKTQCEQEYAGLRDQVMQFLISAEWIQGEAKDQGVKVTDKQVQQQFQQTKKQSFPKESDFQKFLKDSGMTQDDILFRVRLDALSTKLRDKVTKKSKTVSTADITTYYNKNKSRFAQPERRDLLVVLTKTKSTADQARSALQSGQSFSSVAKKYSIDQASKSQGGKLVGVAKGQSEKAFDDAVFSAQKGKLIGPVKTQFGYYVFRVTKVTPASQQTLAQATPTIRNLLTSQNQQKSLNDFVNDFRKRWKGRTDCRKGYVISDCKNAPKAKTTSTSSTTPPGAATTPTPAPSGTTTAP
jgi:foldase protein PrsA